MVSAIARRIPVLVVVVGALVGTAALGASTTRRPAYCPLGPGPAHPDWAFHVGSQVEGRRGTYAHGHGTVSGDRARGQMCQVDRSGPGPDRQITAEPTSGRITSGKRVFVGGVEGNLLEMPIRIASSTDPRCPREARGTATLFASFNGAHKDTVRLSFGKACRDHNHFYHGPQVVVIVPK